MFNRRLPTLLQAGCLIFSIFSLSVAFWYFAFASPEGIRENSDILNAGYSQSLWNGTDTAVPLKEGIPRRLTEAPPRVNAIMGTGTTATRRLNCPAIDNDRYTYLKAGQEPTHQWTNSTVKRRRNSDTTPKYFFALILSDAVHVMPTLLGSLVQAMRFLGPENCALSVVEGRSIDGTYEVLKLLKPEMENLGVKYILQTNEINPKGKGINRVQALSQLRNQALQPLVDFPDQFADGEGPTVIFSNDIALCPEDILELIHQKIYQKADMTCAMDWNTEALRSLFYDVWVARGMTGDTFFEIPPDGSWDKAADLLWNDFEAFDRYQTGRPFQVFSCWNGITAFTAKPLLDRKIKFRHAGDDECNQGEPQIFCKEMWYHGHGRIAVVPSINVAYSDFAGQDVKDTKGYVSKWVDLEGQDEGDLLIQWKQDPPEMVKCMTTYTQQSWVPWNEQLGYWNEQLG